MKQGVRPAGTDSQSMSDPAIACKKVHFSLAFIFDTGHFIYIQTCAA
jgi:hypothetical protein